MRALDGAFAAVYADPLNDEPREALAAALTRAGDPRGAFITTQLAQHRGERVRRDELAQARAALKEHGKAWLAPLDGVLVASTVKWARGFPSAARLNLTGWWAVGLGERSPGAPHPLAGVSALATLRSLKLSSPNMLLHRDQAEQIVALPALRWLRELTDVPRRMLATMAAARSPYLLETIKPQPQGGGGPEGERAEEGERAHLDRAFATATGLPRLRDLDLSWSHGCDRPSDYAWLTESAIGRNLEVLRMEGYYLERNLPTWLEALDSTPYAGLALRELNIHHVFSVSLVRGEGGRWDGLRGDVGPDRYGATVRELNDLLATVGRDRFAEIAVRGYEPSRG